MSKKICSNCRFAIQDTLEMFCLFRKLHTTDGLFKNCHCFLPKSVFHCLTQSPEVMAEKLVYRVEFKSDKGVHIVYRSTLYTNGESWDSEKRAIAATVARLRKVADVA